MSGTTVKNAYSTNSSHFQELGYVVIQTPEMSQTVMESFDNMPRDGHSPKRLRQIRLSQYFCYQEDGEWVSALLPKRRYIQSAEYIHLDEAGGVFRHREQLECDPSPLISSIMNSLPTNTNDYYHININQIRVIANTEFAGITVPEGPHRDGHEFSVIAVAKRHNVRGGETQIINPQTKSVIFRTTLEENQAILIDDERYIHYATNIEPIAGDIGYRDIWVVEINSWAKRAYGPNHDRRASKAALSTVKM